MSTEVEAREKWCPMVRTGLTAGMAVNHHVGIIGSAHAGDVHEETRCVGSHCMMWRWQHPQGRRCEAEQGYCGLAGKES